MTFETFFLWFAVGVIYLAIAVLVDYATPIELDPLPNWLAILFWWAVLPANVICKALKKD